MFGLALLPSLVTEDGVKSEDWVTRAHTPDRQSMKIATTLQLQLCILSLLGNRSFGIRAASLTVLVWVLPLLLSLVHYPLSGDHYPFGWNVGTIMRSATRLNEEQTQLEPGFKHKTFIADFLQAIKMFQNDRKQTHCLHSY